MYPPFECGINLSSQLVLNTLTFFTTNIYCLSKESFWIYYMVKMQKPLSKEKNDYHLNWIFYIQIIDLIPILLNWNTVHWAMVYHTLYSVGIQRLLHFRNIMARSTIWQVNFNESSMPPQREKLRSL